jgi:2-oxoglutarate ferredoxin oxidoreductase subunit delta
MKRVGGAMKLTADKQKLKVCINTSWCKACGICIEFCPKKALGRDADDKAFWEHPDQCIRCGICAERCPDLAIELIKEE